MQAGVFPFPGLSFGWSNAQPQPRIIAGGGGGTALFNTLPPGVTPEEAQEQARIQQRNALIAFAIMVLLFSLRE